MIQKLTFTYIVLFFCSPLFANEIQSNTKTNTDTNTQTSVAKEEWTKPPKSSLFKEFKFLKDMPDKDKKTLIFVKQKKPYYQLTKPYQGDKTVICYGTTKDEKILKITGIACVLSEIGADSCAKASLQKCAKDPSIAPIEPKL